MPSNVFFQTPMGLLALFVAQRTGREKRPDYLPAPIDKQGKLSVAVISLVIFD